MEAKPSAAPEREVTCLACGGLLPARERAFMLKYFLVERPNAPWRPDPFG
jgi:hypothetical protein